MIDSICRHVTDRNRLTAVSLTPEEVPDINGVAAGIGHSDLGYGTILVGRFVDHEEVPAAHRSWPNPRFPPYAELVIIATGAGTLSQGRRVSGTVLFLIGGKIVPDTLCLTRDQPAERIRSAAAW